mgnify:CR=1 FL=1
MESFKSTLLLFLFAIILCNFVSAQQTDMLQFEPFNFSPENGISTFELKNKVFSNAIIGEYQVGQTGVTAADEHIYFIRIQAPDIMGNVIPMPGANNTSLLHPDKIPFYQFSKPRQK